MGFEGVVELVLGVLDFVDFGGWGFKFFDVLLEFLVLVYWVELGCFLCKGIEGGG